MRVLSFGELLLRLRAPFHERLMQRNSLDAHFGGSEGNVAISLAQFGVDSALLTVVPNNAIGEACLAESRRFGVDISPVIRTEGRLGLYYLEEGANYLPSSVIYDREGSTIAKATIGDIDWDAVLDGVDVFHVSGITLALTQNLTDLTMEGLRKAKEKGIKISCDLNYRKNLWKYTDDPIAIMDPVIRLTDILVANDADILATTGIEMTGDDKALVQEFVTRYPNVETVAINLVETKGAGMDWHAGMYRNGTYFESRTYTIDSFVDKVGGGDSFDAGLLYGLDRYDDPQMALEFAVAASTLKFSIVGDFNRVSVADVEQLLASTDNGIMNR